MKKVTGMVMTIAMLLMLAGAAFACWDGSGMGYGPGDYSGANAETMKMFQKETLSLRDELMTKRIELQAEYDKPVPDTARIAALKKDIIDIQAKIQVVADKQGIPTGGTGYGRGMMMGAGCSCPMWQ